MMERSAVDLARRTKSPKRFAKLLRRRANRWKRFRCAKIRFRTRRSASTAVGRVFFDPPHPAQVGFLAAEGAPGAQPPGLAKCSRNTLAPPNPPKRAKPRI